MAILIDSPRWPAHGTQFAHLVSDHSLLELHQFAHAQGLPLVAFDHDHYDVAERHLVRLTGAGARQVSSAELVAALHQAGLRVRRHQRLPTVGEVMPRLRTSWTILSTSAGDNHPHAPNPHGSLTPELGESLMAAWSSPGRHYHDPRHLQLMLTAIDDLTDLTWHPDDLDSLRLAAWFHDAVYAGNPGEDEELSAQWAERDLPDGRSAPAVAEIARLVRLTTTHRPAPDDRIGQVLCDADLSTLAGPPAHYWMYARAIALEYAHLDQAFFRRRRAEILSGFLDRDAIFASERGYELWECQARQNLTQEITFLTSP